MNCVNPGDEQEFVAGVDSLHERESGYRRETNTGQIVASLECSRLQSKLSNPAGNAEPRKQARRPFEYTANRTRSAAEVAIRLQDQSATARALVPASPTTQSGSSAPSTPNHGSRMNTRKVSAQIQSAL